MSLRKLPGHPIGVELQKSREATAHAGRMWQTYIAVDDDDPRVWEHDETRNEWYFLEGSDQP